MCSMFRRSRAVEISDFSNCHLNSNELAIYYLGVSGFIIRSPNHTVLVDPAGMLKGNEKAALKNVDVVLFTHNHLDHFSAGKTRNIFKATSASILAQAKVTDKLKGKIPNDKLVTAEDGKTYSFGDVSVSAVEGIHRGPIILYSLKMDGITVFHGGDSGYVDLKGYPAQLAIVPVGRMSPTASPEDACKMVVDVKPEVAVAMHGSDKQKQVFEEKVKEALPQTFVLILDPFTAKTIPLSKKP